MQHRIFIGISIPEDVKKRLFQRVEKWQELPVKWLKSDNFHLTLSFLGFVDDSAVGNICFEVKNAIKDLEGFDVLFEKISLGPDPENPKMVWLVGEASKELKNIQEVIEKSIGTFVREKKEFRPHITLGKIVKNKWEALLENPRIEENLRISIPVESVEIFESRMEKGRRVYDILESCELK